MYGLKGFLVHMAAVVALLGVAAPVHAQWIDALTRDPSTTNSPGRLCSATNNRADVGCSASAPYVDSAGNVSATGNLSGLKYGSSVVFSGYRANGLSSAPTAVTGGNYLSTWVGYGQGSSGMSTSYRIGIALATAQAWTDSNQGTQMLFMVTPNNTTSTTEAMRIEHYGAVGIGTTSWGAKTLLDVSGTLKIANGGEACDANRLGAIKYQANAFYICQKTSNGWEPLATAGPTSLADRITSNSQAGVIANSTGFISLTTGGVTGTVYFDRGGRLVNAGISTTGPISTTMAYVAGDNSNSPALDVSGSIKISGNGTESCNGTTDNGKMRINPATGYLQVCRQ